MATTFKVTTNLQETIFDSSDKEYPFEDKTLCVTKIESAGVKLSNWERILNIFDYLKYDASYRFTLWKLIDDHWKPVATTACYAEALNSLPELKFRLYKQLLESYERNKENNEDD